MIVNGREYPMYGQFVEKQSDFIGGILEDFGDAVDKWFGVQTSKQTEIMSITLEPNGKQSAFFSVNGRDFSCGFDVRIGGIVAGEEGWITFSGYHNHQWRIKAPGIKTESDGTDQPY